VNGIHEVRKLIDFESWRASAVAENQFRIEPITFGESKEWSFQGGRLVHKSRGFFELVGLRAEARHPLLDGQAQLIIRQRTVAINGLLIRHAPTGCEILFQARVEPGNVGVMQLAPTVQSTEANYRQLHGGKPTVFIEHFVTDHAAFVCDVLQSEEGSRYHGKYNRNAVRLIDDEEIELPKQFRFVPFEYVRQAVEMPNVLNTDSRSVLFCLDWRYLAWPRAPFSLAGNVLATLLGASYHRSPSQIGTTPFEGLAWLARLRAAASINTEIMPIDALENWLIEDDQITEKTPRLGFRARQFHVVATQREVPAWDQPLIDSGTRGRVVLLCQLRNDVLQFLIGAGYEIGFLEGVQLSATVVVPPGQNEAFLPAAYRRLLDLAGPDAGGTLIASCLQSEEGGRFFKDENQYQIVMLDPALEVSPSDEHRWMTLSQITELKAVPSVFSMELRCTLVLLIKCL
jgi:dTDP-4-dehydro-6-deoxy-alpha-D-glucopyranose 2,3-dehydratase